MENVFIPSDFLGFQRIAEFRDKWGDTGFLSHYGVPICGLCDLADREGDRQYGWDVQLCHYLPRANLLFTVSVLTNFSNSKCAFSPHHLAPRKHSVSSVDSHAFPSLSNAQNTDVLNDCGMLMKRHTAIPVDGSDAVAPIYADSLYIVFGTSHVQILGWETKPATVTQHTTLWERPTHTPARYRFVNWSAEAVLVLYYTIWF